MRILRKLLHMFRSIVGIQGIIDVLRQESANQTARIAAHMHKQSDDLAAHGSHRTEDLRAYLERRTAALQSQLTRQIAVLAPQAAEVASGQKEPVGAALTPDAVRERPVVLPGRAKRPGGIPAPAVDTAQEQISAGASTLRERVVRHHFSEEEAGTHRLQCSILLNSLPKSGTVLAARVMRSFIASEDWLPEPWAVAATIDQLRDISNKFIIGHLHLTPNTYRWARDKRHILLLRDPLEHCVSYARFLCSGNMAERCDLGAFIHDHRLSPSFALRMIVLGWTVNGVTHPGVHHEYSRTAAWAGLGTKVIFFEDLLKAVKEPDEQYWRELMSFVGITLPDDWERRVSQAAAPEASQSWAEGLEYTVDLEAFPSQEDMAFLHRSCGDLQMQYRALRQEPH